MTPELRRKGLKLQLALAIDELLGFNHGLSIPNAKRYVTREVRQRFRIRVETIIDLEDWILALQIVRVDRVSHFVRVANDDRTPPEDRFTRIIDSGSIQIARSSSQRKPTDKILYV